jgi:hypothetical protein
MKISSQFPTSRGSPEHIAVAERLGYDHAWLYDTPQPHRNECHGGPLVFESAAQPTWKD